MELGIIRQINIDAEMQASYLDYAMSVIVARALPDVRDGLKPVHRRILYAMHDLSIQPDKPYKKSARIVGEVLGKYHPHGDAAVYEAMVRMAQDFSLRYPLVDGQGNFGSIDGDNAAAMRYTEARLAKIATEMLGDIEKDTVDWTENFDGTLKEPTVLPAALPNLLVNGASGIAVGMSTNVPPHNLGEVCDALCHLIDNHDRHDDVTVEDLLQFIPGPDFPTGGVIYRYQRAGNGDAAEQVDVIAHAYAGGKGSIVMQAKAHIEDMSRNRSRIVVTELPYQTNKTTLLERIAELVRDGRLEGITDLRDESDRTGMRICIEMTRTVEPRQVLADLFKLTPLQQTFGVSMLALVADETGRLEPRLLSLKRMLLHFLEHRQEVIVRRSRFELEKARQRAHILEGLLRALDVLDEIIALIRKSRTADDAKQGLIKQFNFTEIQAQAILDMQLRRLAALERRKLQDEYREVIALIRELEALLNSPKKVLALIRQNLVDLKARYGDARRTQIADRVQGTLTTHDLLPDEDVWVTLSSEGQLTRWRRGAEVLAGKGGPPHLRAAAPLLVSANTRDDLYLFSARGQATRIGIHQIPEGSGSHLADLSGFNRRDRVAALVALPKPGEQPSAPSFLLLATAQGKVKRVALADLADQAQTDPQVIGLDAGDELVWANVSAGGGEVLLVTAQGQAIRFSEEDVRGMGLPAGGIGGIKLGAKDRVVAGAAFGPAASAAHLVLVTALGFAKRTPLADFPAQGRNGQGVVAAKLTPKSGAVAGAALLAADDAVLCVLSGGGNRVLHPDDLPEMGRAATGKQVAGLGGLLTVERVLLLAGAGAVSLAEPEPAPPAPAGKAVAKPKTAPRQPAQSAVKPARSRSASPPAAAEAAKPARRAASTPQAETPAQAPTRPTRGRTTSTTPTRQVGAGSPRPQSAPKPDSAAQSKAGAAEAPKPARTRAKTASVDAAQLALLAETPPDAPEKKPRAAARGKAAPATPAEPPKATSSKAKGVTQAQPEPAAAPAKPAGRPAKQAAASSAPAEPARPGALTATKTATKTPAPPVKATPVPSAAQDKAADKTKPPDKPAAPASKAPVASRKGGTRKSGS